MRCAVCGEWVSWRTGHMCNIVSTGLIYSPVWSLISGRYMTWCGMSVRRIETEDARG